ncbi:hypothetical protein ACROYT_G018741 [Oculina patagonica]
MLVLLRVSGSAAESLCTPCKEYRMIFQEHTTTDYAKIENSITNDLNAVSVCFFARDNDANKPDTEQCLFSYTVNGADNSLLIITSPTLRVIINDKKRDSGASLEYGKWNHICFTWTNTNGEYWFYKDGVAVATDTGLNTGGTIRSGGTTVIGQEQDAVGGGFQADQSFVGDVTQVNIWDRVLSDNELFYHSSTCNTAHGSVNSWSQFKDGVHGGVVVEKP